MIWLSGFQVAIATGPAGDSTMSKIAKQVAVVAPSFAPAAAQIVSAHKIAHKATEKLGVTVQKILIQFLDGCGSVPRTREGCESIAKVMREQMKPEGILGKALTANIGLKRATVSNYIVGAQIAHFQGSQWKASLFQEGLPWNKGDASTTSTKSKATSANKGKASSKAPSLKDFEQALLAAIGLARSLNLRDLANELGALAASRIEKFAFTAKSE